VTEPNDAPTADEAPEVDPHAAAVTGVSPSSGAGRGPMFLEVTGTGFSTTATDTTIAMKDAGGATVGTSPAGIAASSRSFASTVTFTPGTPAGALTPWLVQGGVGVAGPAASFRFGGAPVAAPPGAAVYGPGVGGFPR
jgi:hypothetical protein